MTHPDHVSRSVYPKFEAMIRRIPVLLLLLVFAGGSLRAGKIEKGYEALRIYNYFRAKELFIQSFEKHPAAAGYGLALIYSRTDNPFHDVSLAHANILCASWSVPKLSAKEKLRLKTFGVNDSLIFSLKEKIDSMGFRETQKKNSVAAWDNFIDEYCGSVLIADATARRNQLAYANAQLAGTWQAFKEFTEKYPEAEQYALAVAAYDRLLFETLTADSAISSYEKFLADYPRNPFVPQAQDALFRLSTPGHSIGEYHDFIRKYPENRNVPDAWRRIYALYTADGKSTTIAQFWIAFPDFPFKETISEDLRLSMTSFYPIRIKNDWGFVDSTGTVRIPCQYEWVDQFADGYAAVGKNSKSGYIGKNGKTLIPFDYDEAEPFRKGFAPVEKNEKVGLTDKAGHLVVPVSYDQISDYVEARAVVVRNGKYGYIDMGGNEVVNCHYEKAGDFSGGLAYVVDSSKYGFIDRSGRPVIAPQFQWVEAFSFGCARVKKDDKYGLLAADGTMLLPCEYSFIGAFSEGIALVVKDDKCGYIRRDGKILIPVQYEYNKTLLGESPFVHGKAKVLLDGKCGMIDTLGKIVVPREFDDVFPFENGLSAVRKKDKWGYIDAQIRLKIPYKYEYAWTFSEGLARVKTEDGIGYIDAKGKEIVAPQFEEASDCKNGYLLVNDGNGWGLMDSKGNWILPCKYDKIEFLNDRELRLERNEKFGYYHLMRCEFIWKEDGLE